ncbi:MAG: nuclear transport factor 2 family protein [Acidobacteria bacterium]|nr:nuclear transport factor 2 family protein [Acidobacteriota bacterium]
MFSRLLLTALALCCSGFAQTGSSAIENLDKAWIKALLSRDAATLDRLLSKDLIYAHASGVVDTKSEYIEKLRSGRQVYKTLDQKNVSVRLHGDSAVTHSWARVTGVSPQGPFDDKIMMIHVWVKSGSNWQLAAHQTTRVDKLP